MEHVAFIIQISMRTFRMKSGSTRGNDVIFGSSNRSFGSIWSFDFWGYVFDFKFQASALAFCIRLKLR
jgi:hypothetical protein